MRRGLLWLLGMLASWPVQAQLPSQFWGMHVHQAKHYPALPPFGSLRLWDSGVCWYQLQPAPDKWQWDLLDQRVAQAQAAGQDLLYVLGQTPTWASSNPNDTISPYCKGCNYNPRDLAHWEAYVRAVVQRYKGRIAYYELWNEPNFNLFYNQPADSLRLLADAAFRIITTEDSSARVVSPGFIANNWHWQNQSGPQWMRAYFGSHTAPSCHVLGVHLYTKDSTVLEWELLPLMDTVLAIQQALGLAHLPIWDTETGYGNTEEAKASKVLYLRGDSASAYVARAHLLRWARGFGRFYWYGWDNLSWVGLFLLEPDYSTPTQGQLTYRQLRAWLLGAHFQSLQIQKDGTYVLQYRIGRQRACMVWHPVRTTDWQPKGKWRKAQVSYLHKADTHPAGKQVQVGMVPLRLSLP